MREDINKTPIISEDDEITTIVGVVRTNDEMARFDKQENTAGVYGHFSIDVYGDWTKRREVNDGGCVLVRPDRIVAWRSMDLVPQPEKTLRDVMERIVRPREGGVLTEQAAPPEEAAVS